MFQKGFLKTFVLSVILLGFNAQAAMVDPGRAFPVKPDPTLTPGSLCERPDSRRYPEKIAYCARDVETSLKWAIIQEYNERLGYKIVKRRQFKIDHLIPLCAGGSNQPSNLWPQHESIYRHTDPIEPLLCSKMREGRLKQKDAVEIILEVKNDISKAHEVLRYLQRL